MNDLARREAARALAALQFLTILPIRSGTWEEDRLARGMAWFPLAGLLIGLLAYAVFLVAQALSPPLAPMAALLALVVLSGALHEDGLADVADGLGARDRERALEIMTDSRIGAFGAIAIVFSLAFRWQALAAIPPERIGAALLAAPAIARAMMVPVAASLRYARPEGTGSLAAAAGGREAGIALALALVLSLLFGGLGAFVLAALAALAVAAVLKRRLGGYTGDGLGAVCQAAEIAAFAALAGGAAWP